MSDAGYGPATRKLLWDGFARLNAETQVALLINALPRMNADEQISIMADLVGALQPHLLQPLSEALNTLLAKMEGAA